MIREEAFLIVLIVSFHDDNFILFHHTFIFNLHSQLLLRISGITKTCYIKTRANIKISLFGQLKYSAP